MNKRKALWFKLTDYSDTYLGVRWIWWIVLPVLTAMLIIGYWAWAIFFYAAVGSTGIVVAVLLIRWLGRNGRYIIKSWSSRRGKFLVTKTYRK